MNRKRIGISAALLAALLLAALIGAGTAGRRGAERTEEIGPADGRDFVRAVLDYDAGTRTLRGTQTLTLTNRTGETLEEIVLRAYMNGRDDASVIVSGASIGGEPVSLTPIEYDILKFLLEHPGKVYSSKELYWAVWGESPLGSEGVVAVHIRHLREKLEIDPSDPRYIKVVWGQGYKMEGGKP